MYVLVIPQNIRNGTFCLMPAGKSPPSLMAWMHQVRLLYGRLRKCQEQAPILFCSRFTIYLYVV